MKTYWFTIADGERYRVHAERLRRSLEIHGIPLDILAPGAPNSQEAKHRKIDGILAAPAGCERIVYLDADTLALDPAGIDRVSGAWRIPWRIPVEGCLPKTLDPRLAAEKLEAFYLQHGLAEFAAGGSLAGVEWNSGVIAGDRTTMTALAQEWAVWWDRILELFDGHFRRDQLSFRIAFRRVCLEKHPAGLPAETNWIVSYFGINPNARLLHRTMVKNVPWLEEGWERLAARVLAGEQVGTGNRSFDLGGITTGLPSLQRRTDLDPAVEADLLRQTLAFAGPERVLLVGEDPARVLPLVREGAGAVACAPSLDRLPDGADPAGFDLVIFCGCDYTVPEALRGAFRDETVFCFSGLHDLALYEGLHTHPHVRILAPGCGLFSRSARIAAWTYAT